MWNTESDADESFRKKVIWGSAAIVVIGLVGAVYYYKYHSAVPEIPVPAGGAEAARGGPASRYGAGCTQPHSGDHG